MFHWQLLLRLATVFVCALLHYMLHMQLATEVQWVLLQGPWSTVLACVSVWCCVQRMQLER
jgi:hypothetical protein